MGRKGRGCRGLLPRDAKGRERGNERRGGEREGREKTSLTYQ